MPKPLLEGYNQYLKENDNFKMLMDVGILKLAKNDTYAFKSNSKEKALLIWSGKIKITIGVQQQHFVLARTSIWEESPMAFHCSKQHDIFIEALEASEMVLQAKTNTNKFPYKLYDQSNCKVTIAGNNYHPSVSTRIIVDIFNYENAPYSNMVLGEVTAQSGHWSGYPPHNHQQPEVYIYRFNQPQGFGIGIAGDDATIVKNYDALYISSMKMHQNACAPGYQMYFVWLIPHLPNDPWNKRNYDQNHVWINEPKLIIKDTKDFHKWKK